MRVWITRGKNGEYTVLVKARRGYHEYAAREVWLDNAPVGRVVELHVEAEAVRVVEKEGGAGELAVFVVSRAHALAEELANMLSEVPVTVSASL